MGMFDSISIYMKCPLCGQFANFVVQTKDLDCVMFHYQVLPGDWFTYKWGKKFRESQPVYAKFPLDKEAAVWSDQAERMEAAATVNPEFANQLNVTVIAECPECRKFFDGKIHIKDSRLIGEIYDVEC